MPDREDKKVKKQEALIEERSVEDDVEQSNFIWESIKQSFDPLTQQVTDTNINTSDLRMASSYFDFCKMISKDMALPFARQLWIAAHLFADFCPRCSNKHYSESIENVPVDMDVHELGSHFAFLENGVCPKCFATRGTLIKTHELNPYNELIAVLGQRSGKSTMTSLMTAYILHLLLKTPKLSSIYGGVLASTPLMATFVALTTKRANQLLWTPFVSVLTGCAWFKEYHSILIQAGKKEGFEFLKFNKDTITYSHRNLGLYYMGPMKRALRGDTRFLGAIDELGLFPLVNPENTEEDESRELANADEVHTSLANSLLTVRNATNFLYNKGVYHIPTGYMLNTSSPMSVLDKIWRLLQDSKNSVVSLGVNLPTWEVNPYITRDTPAIVEQYRINPVKAERDFGARPSSNETQWYTRESVTPLFTGTNHVRISPYLTELGLSGKVVFESEPSRAYPSAVSVDAGFNNNSFAVAMGHLENDNLRVTALLELIPKDSQIFFTGVYRDILSVLIKKMNGYFLFTDRWQSISIAQSAKEEFLAKDFQWVPHSLTLKDFDTFDTDMIHGRRLILPKVELEQDFIYSSRDYRKDFLNNPASHLLHQFSTVRRLGGTMLKGPNNTDDLYRAVVLLATGLRMNKVADRMVKLKPQERIGLSSKGRILSAGKRIIG